MITLPWLENSQYTFPDVETALTEPDGLLCASMHLNPELVIDAYQQGVFPWYSEEQPVLWWSPDCEKMRCFMLTSNHRENANAADPEAVDRTR